MSLDMPPFGTGGTLPLATDQDAARLSMLQDALHASPVVELEPIVDPDPTPSELLDNSTKDANAAEQANGHALLPGSVIPAVLVQGIDTRLPGIAVGMVSRDVFDTRTGKTLLVPRGSRTFGTYGNQNSQSARVLVSWSRIDLPNGYVVELPKVVGADPSGNAGLEDKINRHTARTFAVTGVTSLISAGLSYVGQAERAREAEQARATAQDELDLQAKLREEAARNAEEGESVAISYRRVLPPVVHPTIEGVVGNQLAEDYGKLGVRVANQYLAQGPTLSIRPGYEFTIQIAEEVLLEPYARDDP